MLLALRLKWGLRTHRSAWRGMIRGWRSLVLLGMGLMLAGCSWVSVGYNRLPDLARLWLDRQLKLEAPQAEVLMDDLKALHEWHKQQQLPLIATTLRRWQTLVVAESLSADQVCQEMTQVRGLLSAVSTQALPGMVRLARHLGPTQYAALQASQQKSHAEFRQLWLESPRRSWLPQAQAADTDANQAQERLTQRVKASQSRYEMLYGALNTAQLADLRHTAGASSFAPALALAERERRTQDLLQTLKAIQALPVRGDEAEAKALVQGWLDRLATSPDAAYARASRVWQQETCTQWARLHQLTTPEQRQHARQLLAGYEADAQQLRR
jgi:hypothetical protein